MQTATATTNLLEAHEQWRNRPADERFESLSELKMSVNLRRLRSRSVDVDISKLGVESDGTQLVINSQLAPCVPTHWSFGQLAAQLGPVPAPAGYLRSLPTDLLTRCMSFGLQQAKRDDCKFMTLASEEPDQPNTLQAVTSPTYGRIWDSDCVDAVSRIVERTGNKFYNPKDWSGKPSGLYASDHDVFMFMIDGGSLVDVGPRARLNRGFICWNSETGARTFGLMTFLFNVVCGNHIIWGASEVNKLVIRHTSGGPYRFDSQAAPLLRSYADSSALPLQDTVRRAMNYRLPAPDELVEFVGRHAKFSRSEIAQAVSFAKSEEGQCATLWDFIQGATAYARGFDFIDARLDLEKRAGALLNLASN